MGAASQRIFAPAHVLMPVKKRVVLAQRRQVIEEILPSYEAARQLIGSLFLEVVRVGNWGVSEALRGSERNRLK